jgi:hypothetical protein
MTDTGADQQCYHAIPTKLTEDWLPGGLGGLMSGLKRVIGGLG